MTGLQGACAGAVNLIVIEHERVLAQRFGRGR